MVTALILPTAFLRKQWPIVVGAACLFLPTLISLAVSLWPESDQQQGPIVLLMAIWLFAVRCRRLPARAPGRPIGLLPLVLGLAMYVFGRSQQIWLGEVGGFIPLLAGLLLYQGGTPLLRHFAVPLLFILFLIPLPGFFVDWLTADLKALVSALSAFSASALGYPVARSGVILVIGHYQLLMADACSGMNSMFSLAALGTLYSTFRQDRHWLDRCLMFAAIIPVSILANVLRVLILMLVTYHFGDAVGEGFIHSFAGMLLFVSALAMLAGLDGLLRIALPGSAA